MASKKETSAAVRELSRGETPLDDIQVSANFRRHFDLKKLQELADNIAKVGVLEPILLRKGETKFLLIAGERRFRAAKMAGLKKIPSRVLDVDENQAAEIQALENLHREDLGPIDEARAFRALLDQGNYTVEALADRIDKSVPYVYRAIRLLELPEEILTAIEQGNLTPAHGHALLRAPKERRDEFVKEALADRYEYDGPLTAKDLAERIESEIGRDLEKAPFPKDVEFAGKIACKDCPYNSGNQGMLFDGAEKGHCLEGSCFDAKLAQHMDGLAEKAKGTFKGLEFLGVHEADFNDFVVIDSRRALVMTTERKEALGLGKDLLADAKKNPKAWAWIIAKPRRHSDASPKAILVCRDSGVLPKTKAKEASLPGVDRAATIRKNFIDRRVNEALLKAGIDSVEKIQRGHIIAIIDRMGLLVKPAQEMISVHLEKPKGDAPLNVLFQWAFARAIVGYGDVDHHALKSVGVDVKKVTAAAREAAEQELDAKKKAKKA